MAPKEQFTYEEKRSPVARYGFLAGVILLAIGGVGFAVKVFSGKSPAPRKAPEMVMIKPVAPPPPPPPPPPPQNVPKQVEEQTQVSEQDMKPAEQPQEDPTPSLGTNLTGNGPDGFGLGKKDAGFYAGNSGKGGAGGSRFGGYYQSVVRAVTDALGRHPDTRNASFEIRLHLWSDATGRITRVKLKESTGDEKADAALRGAALAGCQLPDIPAGMKMPIELRLRLKRPNG